MGGGGGPSLAAPVDVLVEIHTLSTYSSENKKQGGGQRTKMSFHQGPINQELFAGPLEHEFPERHSFPSPWKGNITY